MFHLKAFTIQHDLSAQRVGTDALLLGAWSFRLPSSPRRILDVGTGTGIIALLLAQRFPEAQIEGWELEEEACREAQANFHASPFADRLRLRHTNFLDQIPTADTPPSFPAFDLIVSNPPYFPETTASPDQLRRLARHTDEAGLSPETLLRHAPRLLSPSGALALVTPATSLPTLRQVATESLLRLSELVEVYSVPDRLVRTLTLWQPLRQGAPYLPTHRTSLTLLDEGGRPSVSYRELMTPYLLPEHL